jgi:hypothetical protein
MRRTNFLALALIIFAPCMVPAQLPPLTIATDSLPSATAGTAYQLALNPQGGVMPYTWALAADSKLPPGLRLHPRSGRITGTPTTPGQYHFTVMLNDVNVPPGRVQREFTLPVLAGLTVEWVKAPHVSGTWISGTLVVSNQTGQPANLTVIVAAVNEYGRATALGYQRFTIQPNSQQEIPFGANPGPGQYMVRADAIAVFGPKRTLRAHKETGGSELVIDEV